MYDDFGYGGAPQVSTNMSGGALIWLIIACVLAVVGGIVIYFTFLREGNRGRYQGFLKWLYEFLHFRKITLEKLLKILYLIGALMITLGSFAFIGSSFLAFLIILIFGNVFLRISYEYMMLLISIWRNTNDIADKVAGDRYSERMARKAEKAAAAAPAPAPVEEVAAPTMKTCPNCGNAVDAEAKFCKNCGAPFA